MFTRADGALMGLKVETRGKVATFTLENGSHNVLTPAIHRALYQALCDFEADPELSVAILTAAGTKAFSAGDDLKTPRPVLPPGELIRREIFGGLRGKDAEYPPSHAREVLALRRTKPLVGAATGWCIGQGLVYFARLADLRIAGKSARFGLPEIGYGMAGAAAIAQLDRHMPRAIALRMALTGQPIDAEEAYRVGFVNELVEDDALLTAAHDLASQIARHPTLALQAEMLSFQRPAGQDDDAAYVSIRQLNRLQMLARCEGDFPEDRPLAYSGRTPSEKKT